MHVPSVANSSRISPAAPPILKTAADIRNERKLQREY